MKVVIVEDEVLASSYLKSLLEQQSHIVIQEIVVLNSVIQATKYLFQNKVDLIFMDIHLGDGKSLEIFDKVHITSPIIFITAYDNYAIEVFKQFTLDYILKPFSLQDLNQALNKVLTVSNHYLKPLESSLSIPVKPPLDSLIKQNFLIYNAHKLKRIKDQEVAYFFAQGKHLYLHTFNEFTYLYDDTLKQISTKIDKQLFFKINRKYIININAVQDIIKHSSQKIELKLKVRAPDQEPIIVSKNNITELLAWLS